MPFHWPRHNYLGPGTKDFTKEPIDEDDDIARRHDLAYANATSHQDIYKADKEASKEFFDSFKKTWHPEAFVGSAALKVKNFTEEKIVGRPLYGMPTKDWGRIKKINEARARRRQAEESVDDLRREYGPPNIYDADTDPEAAMGSQSTDVPDNAGGGGR